MPYTARLRRITTWWALAAMVMMALAPTVSHALQPRMPGAWVELCTSLGSKWVRVADDGVVLSSAAPLQDPPAQPPLPVPALDHCGYCTLHTHDVGLVGTPFALPLLLLSFEVPCPSGALVPSANAWLAGQPRGPPALS